MNVFGGMFELEMRSSQANPTPWLARGEQKRQTVQQLFAEIAPVYDLMNRIISLRRDRSWRRAAVARLELKRGDTAIDLCCGTGDFMLELEPAVGETGTVLGVDFCAPMLAIAAQKISRGSSLSLGDACAVPLKSEMAEAVSVGWGLRNVPDLDAALKEAFRVLKPGGRFVSLDMAIPKNVVVKALSSLHTRMVLPLLGAIFLRRTAYTYLPKSTMTFSTPEELAEKMRAAGFTDVAVRGYMLGNITMHWGRKP